ncbi:MAG: response regulator transcription factor [Anaerolineae bacterium]|nr:response regulator transcription factor [Anaerolineae bacterium]
MESSDLMIRVLIVDDHPVVRNGISLFLETCEDIECVGQVDSGRKALRACDELQPDVVLMDVVMPDMNGVETTRAIRESHDEIQIIALTSFENEESVPAMIDAGAISYLLKNVAVDEIADAIRRAYQGKGMLSPEASQALVRSVNRPKPLGHDLTARELEVLALIVKGLNNTEIGEILFISTSTVKNHVSNILAKMDAVTRSEAAALAVQHKLVAVE